jgi:hypothetical protein
MKLLVLLEETPPFVLYYLCGAGDKHPGYGALAEKACLSISTIIRLSQSISWKRVPLGTLDRFCKAVGVDFISSSSSLGCIRGQRNYFNKPFKVYLTNLVRCTPKDLLPHLSTSQRKRFFKLCAKWKKSRELPF